MKHKTGLLNWNSSSGTAKKKKKKKERGTDKFQILVLSTENDQEIILFRISAYQINTIKPVLNLWYFYISCVRAERVIV